MTIDYSGRTGGILDLIGRRAMWGVMRVRVTDVNIDEKGAHATFREVGKEKEYQRPVTELRLVPMEDMPGGGNTGSSDYSVDDDDPD